MAVLRMLSIKYAILEACPLTKSDLQSIDFVINRFFMKLLKTNNTDHVKYCQHCFSFDMPSKLWQKRVKAFEGRFSEMHLCAFR